MLVLKRKWGEAIYVQHKGETLQIIVNYPNSSTSDCRVCFHGPRSFDIVRDDARVKEKPSGTDS